MAEDEDLLGDGVNIAARLEQIAEPGGVCISGTVHEHVAGKLSLALKDIGEQALKNIARPVRVYTVAFEHAEDLGAAEARPEEALALPDKPSIAVLPYDNMSGDPE